MNLLKRRSPRERGAAAVEMAIVLPVLVALAFGIIDFSRVFNAELQISQAAREGARLAALADGGANYTKTDVRNRALAAAPAPGFGTTAPTIPDGDITLCQHSPGRLDTSSVKVSYSFAGIFWSQNISQTAVMRCGG